MKKTILAILVIFSILIISCSTPTETNKNSMMAITSESCKNLLVCLSKIDTYNSKAYQEQIEKLEKNPTDSSDALAMCVTYGMIVKQMYPSCNK